MANNKNKPRKTNFINIHNMMLCGTVENPRLRFTAVTKGFKEQIIEIEMDDFDIRELSRIVLEHTANIEQEAKSRLKQLRKSLNYSNTEPEITYKHPVS